MKKSSPNKVPNGIESDSKFKDRTKIKNQYPEDKPKDGKDSPWDFRCPQYDQRSSNFINAGTHYGIGVRQPIGTKGNAKMTGETIPFGRKDTMRIDEVG